jgi:uncharacterized OsmC-like protein
MRDMAQSQIRTYAVQARSTDTFGRVLVSARDQHLVVDGPAANGCPGEAVGPGELFLGGVVTCGIELVQVIAKEQNVAPKSVRAEITGTMDRANPVRQDLRVFNAVALKFRLEGVTQAQADDLIDRFRRR